MKKIITIMFMVVTVLIYAANISFPNFDRQQVFLECSQEVNDIFIKKLIKEGLHPIVIQKPTFINPNIIKFSFKADSNNRYIIWYGTMDKDNLYGKIFFTLEITKGDVSKGFKKNERSIAAFFNSSQLCPDIDKKYAKLCN